MKKFIFLLAVGVMLFGAHSVSAAEVTVFDSTDNYLGACSFTDSSAWTLTKDLHVYTFKMWYYWQTGETTLPITVYKDGAEFAKFDAARGNCDQFQPNWCNADYIINKDFPAGNYTTKIPTAFQCLKPGGTGTVRLYGTSTTTASANTNQSANTNAAAANTNAAVETMVFDSTDNYLGGCSMTDASEWTLTEDLNITKFQLWYYWQTGETTLSVTVYKDGTEFAKFDATRAACDPYQTSWCNADYAINKTFPAGTYSTKIAKAQQCLKPGSTGTVRLYGSEVAAGTNTNQSANTNTAAINTNAATNKVANTNTAATTNKASKQSGLSTTWIIIIIVVIILAVILFVIFGRKKKPSV